MGATKVAVPVIGQGTWRMEGDDQAACIAALRRGLELGMTHIDTAELYGSGKVEENIVSKAIAGRRSEVYLVSKVLPSHADFAGTLDACEGSLRRLKTDYLDLYLLHWPGSHPLEETIGAFVELKKQGKIRAFGVSNFDVDDLEEAVRLAGAKNVACNQVLYHLEERSIEKAVVPACEKHGVSVVAYSPFGAGRFPGAKHPGRAVLEAIAAEKNASAYQVALRFLVRRPSVFAIPKHSKSEHADDNAGASNVSLTSAEIERIERAFPLRARRGLPVI
jgi:diketogulonate reductase-like aldo/keto reductase